MLSLRLSLSALVLGMIAAAAPAPASGHAVLLETDPTDGAVLEAAPDEVVFRFNEAVSPIRVQVLGPGGEIVANTDDARAEDSALIVALPALGEGTHVVSYRARSLDGHPVGGSISFAIGAASPAPGSLGAGDREMLWRVAEGTARFLKIVAVFTAAGGVFYRLLVARGAAPGPPLRRAMVGAAAPGIAAAVLEAGFYGALLLDAEPLALLGAEPWRAGLAGTEGLSILILGAGLALVALASAVRRALPRNALLAVGAFAALASFALTGHVAAAEPRWLGMPALALHVGCAAFWAGSLVPLWLAARHSSARDLASHVERFSRIAVAAVAGLIVAGLALAWVILERPSDLVESRYGWMLLGKVALIATLVAIAAVNKLSLTPRLGVGDETARRFLARNILVEIGLMAAVVGLAVALAQSPPPRHAHHGADYRHAHDSPRHDRDAAEMQRYAAMIESGTYRAFVSVEPARAGSNLLMVRVTDGDGAVVEPIEVTVDIANEALGIEPLSRAMRPVGAGHFAITGEDFTLPGIWQLRIDALITDFDKKIFRTEVEIR